MPLCDGKRFLIENTEGVVLVIPKRANAIKAHAFVETEGFMLVDSGFQPQQRHPLRLRVIGKMIEDRLRKAPPAKLGPHVHALDLAVFRAKKFDSAAGRRSAIGAQHKKRHTFIDESLNTQTMPAFLRV